MEATLDRLRRSPVAAAAEEEPGAQYSPHEAAFALPASYSTEARALLLQRAVQLLTTQGIGVSFRHAAPPQLARPARRRPCSARRA